LEEVDYRTMSLAVEISLHKSADSRPSNHVKWYSICRGQDTGIGGESSVEFQIERRT